MNQRFTSLFLLVMAIIPFPVAGAESNRDFENRRIVTLPAGTIINKDYFATGETVKIDGTVNGDVYAAGGKVIVNGNINGDLLVAGGMVIISGKISENVRVVSGELTVTGEIGKNLTVGAGHLKLAPSARIHGTLVAGAGEVNLEAPLDKAVTVAAGLMTLSSTVNGNVEAAVARLNMTSSAIVKGDLKYWSDKEPVMEPGSRVVGEIIAKKPIEIPLSAFPDLAEGLSLFAYISKIINFISTLVFGLFLIHFFPKFPESQMATLRKKPWISVGVGFLVLLTVPAILVFLFLTIFGIPLALIVFMIYLVTLYAARISVILWVGIVCFERFGVTGREKQAFTLALCVYFLLGLIPMIGSLVTILVLTTGIGAALLTDRALYFSPRRQEMT